MARLSDLPEWERAHLLSKNGAPFEPPAWVEDVRPAAERRFALITTAGLHRAGDTPFGSNDASYRVLPGEVTGADLVMSHTSVNFDRTAWQDDVNVVFPIDRFREREARGEVGSLAAFHVSFMGAGSSPAAYERGVGEVARALRRDGVDAAFLTPV